MVFEKTGVITGTPMEYNLGIIVLLWRNQKQNFRLLTTLYHNLHVVISSKRSEASGVYNISSGRQDFIYTHLIHDYSCPFHRNAFSA